MAMADDPRAKTVGRMAAIDLARGLAVGGMILFHLDWDLAYWGWRDLGPADSPAWMAFGHAVAATFLFVSGLCLALARHRGYGPALRRIALLAGAAALVTAVTRWLFPGEFIFFGILHCIAVSNLIGLALLDAPAWIVLPAAALAALVPTVVSSTLFDGPAWWWLGLSKAVPTTLDYRALLPWSAPVLLGIAAGRIVPRLPALGQPLASLKGLRWAGRHSLLIYLVHQPLMFGLFFLLATIHPARIDERASFSRQCVSQCVTAGAGQAGCEAACGCVLRRIGGRLGPSGAATPPSTSDLSAASELCLRDTTSQP